MNKKLKLFVCILLVVSIMLSITMSTFAVNESEANNTLATADRIYDDANNYGYISSTSDADWWVISFDIDGFANFYLGSIPQSCNYNMHIYKNNGTLIASSTEPYYYSELFRIRIYKNTDYYIKIVSASGTSSTDSYKLRCKLYALQPARIFTVDSSNVWAGDFYGANAINTRQDAQVIIPNLWSMGYTATEYENNSASAAVSVYDTSDILIVSSHGNVGKMGFNNSTLYANYNATDGTNNKTIFGDVNDASELELIIYATCLSGCDSEYDNLVDVTLDRGANICIGWTTTVPNNAMNDWFDKLFDELSTGQTVAAAISSADNYVASIWSPINVTQIKSRYFGASSDINKLILGGY